MITKEYLNEIFEYRNGMIFWKNPKVKNQTKAGSRAGSLHHGGYRNVRIDMKYYLEHRVIWIMHIGDIPEGYFIDHRDNIKDNNDIDNLRLATRPQNHYNVPRKKNNTSGYKGVSFRRKTGKWMPTIRMNGKSKNLGSYDTPEQAHEVYKAAAIQLHGDFAKY